MPAAERAAHMSRAWIGLGSNLQDRRANLQFAVAALQRLGAVNAISSIWETAPVGNPNQPQFLNAVLELHTRLGAAQILTELLAIEQRCGRRRTQPPDKGPRTLDLDLLLMQSPHGPVILDEPGLTLPHRELHLRRFVMAPLAEIAPDLVHPVTGTTIAQLLASLPSTGPNDVQAVTKAGRLAT